VDATVNDAKPTAKKTLKAASTPMTASGDCTAASVSVSKLHNRRDIPAENQETYFIILMTHIRF
jgi:hypothetical protein